MKTAVVILPGRGTYNKGELGVIGRTFPSADLLAAFDAFREAHGQPSLSELDGAARFSSAVHGSGENASSLIFAASLGDVLSLDHEAIDVVAVTGNSLGWYTTLAAAGALEPLDGFRVANTMGRWMQELGQGGQLVYPHMAEDWSPERSRRRAVMDLVGEIDEKEGCTLALSIDLGGHLVLAGNEAGLAAFERAVPRVDRFPMRLPGHVAFHSHLVAPVSHRALTEFAPAMFGQPDLPMIDGRGQIWWPGACDPVKLRDYTFGHQVVEPYDFTRAVTVAAREFAPDIFIVAGPGTTLVGAVAQSLVGARWQGMGSKSAFKARQAESPLVVSMGAEDERAAIVSGASGVPGRVLG